MWRGFKELFGIWFGNTAPKGGKSWEEVELEIQRIECEYVARLLQNKLDAPGSATIGTIRQACEELRKMLHWDDCYVVGEAMDTLYVFCGGDKEKQRMLVGVLYHFKPVGVRIVPLMEVYQCTKQV